MNFGIEDRKWKIVEQNECLCAPQRMKPTYELCAVGAQVYGIGNYLSV